MTAEVYKEFYARLVKTLPMDDVTFTAELYSRDLLPGDVRDLVKSQATRASKAAYFLDHVIEPSLANTYGSFNKLLKVMENCEYDNVKELAELITNRLMEGPENTSIGEFCVCKPGSGCHH